MWSLLTLLCRREKINKKMLSKIYNKWCIIFKNESFDFTNHAFWRLVICYIFIFMCVCMHRNMARHISFLHSLYVRQTIFILFFPYVILQSWLCTTLATYTNLSVKRKMITLKDMMMQKRKMRSFFIRCMFYHRLNCMISKRKTILHYILPTRVYFDVI